MNLFLYFFLALICSVIFALLEIQIEGAHGWAGKLPTWKLHPGFLRHIPGFNRSLTGYHLYLWAFLFIYPQFIFVFIPLTLSRELLLISFLVLITLIEDFLWFVFNPHYGLGRFKPESVPWHSPWLGQFPLSYYFGVLFWIILFSASLVF